MTSYGPGTALIVVDMQNDFAHPDGSLRVVGSDGVLARVNAEIVSAIAAGSPVFYTQDWHPESTPHFEKDGGVWPVHCVADSWGAEFHSRLLVAGPSVRKGANGEDGYSGFTMRDPVSGETRPTELRAMLGDTTRTVVVGLALDYCVKETALDAARLGFHTEVPLNATAAVNLEPHHGSDAVAALAAARIATTSDA